MHHMEENLMQWITEKNLTFFRGLAHKAICCALFPYEEILYQFQIEVETTTDI